MTGAATTVTITTPGAVTWTGQSLNLRTTVVPTAGALTWAGQPPGSARS